jgi:hypothetical protein
MLHIYKHNYAVPGLEEKHCERWKWHHSWHATTRMRECAGFSFSWSKAMTPLKKKVLCTFDNTRRTPRLISYDVFNDLEKK